MSPAGLTKIDLDDSCGGLFDGEKALSILIKNRYLKHRIVMGDELVRLRWLHQTWGIFFLVLGLHESPSAQITAEKISSGIGEISSEMSVIRRDVRFRL